MRLNCEDLKQVSDVYTCDGAIKKGVIECDKIEPFKCNQKSPYILFGFDQYGFSELDAYIEYLYKD